MSFEDRDKQQSIPVEESIPFSEIPHVAEASAQHTVKLGDVTEFLHDEIKVKEAKDDETLVDVHIGNPLHKITLLLEEIKKQKAFTFSIKGSLGVAGIVVVLGTFGIFGGSKALCSKGAQTRIGVIKALKISDKKEVLETGLIAKINALYTSIFPHSTGDPTRMILEGSGGSILTVLSPTSLSPFNRQRVFVTGDYDSCTQALTVKDTQGVELYK